MPARPMLASTLPGRPPGHRPSPRGSRGSDRRDLRGLLGSLAALPTYSEHLGLNLEDPSDWFPWFVSASLFAKPIPATAAVRTASLLLRSGVRTPREVERTGWDGLVQLLDAGGYARYDFSTADKLLEIARGLREPGTLPTLAKERSFPKVEERLARIRGVGPKTVEIFLRELQGYWKSSPPWSEEARAAGRRLGVVLTELDRAPSRRRRVETGLVRLWLEHCKPGRWQDCPVGFVCGCRPPEHQPSAVEPAPGPGAPTHSRRRRAA